MPNLSHVALAAGGACALALLSFGLGLLSRSGAMAAALLGTLVAGAAGWGWCVPFLLFFLTGSLLSRLAPRNRFEAKGARRDAVQVVANGGVAAVAAILHLATGDAVWSVVALGSLAAAAADTWATESGGMTRGRTISLATLRAVEPGRSGGVSLAGTLGGAVGALLIAASGAAAGMVMWNVVPLIGAAGVAGMLVDSLAGGTLQYVGRCSVCGALVEKPEHCGAPTEQVRGARWMTNDAVNGLCTVVGGGAGYLLVALAAR